MPVNRQCGMSARGHRGLRLLLRLMCAVCVASATAPLKAHEQDDTPVRALTAIRATTPPRIDGVLDDPVWQRAPAGSAFVQRDPDEGRPATEKTVIQVAFDDEALYVGVMCYDSEPDRIASRLARRDHFINTGVDRVTLNLDPHHDHQTGYYFMVYPSETQLDAAIHSDGRFDSNWDGVWEARTHVDARGWGVEYRIPYHDLRFSQQDNYIWGINVDRVISRKNESVYWSPRFNDQSGWVSLFGHLVGIEGIRPPRHVEVLPYALARNAAESGHSDPFVGAGADIRYDIAPNISLNATLNPDFGQVEADPAVLNLTVFETFFQERRPFFVESAAMFRTPIQLFYSRRIGRRPGHFPTTGAVVELPHATTILGAAKVAGKTSGKTSFGIVEAVTAAEYATVEETVGAATRVRYQLIEPRTNYLVGRVQQDVLAGNSRVGLLVTSVNRRDAESAYTGGVDWDLRRSDGVYGISGQIAGARAATADGYAAQFSGGKRGGRLTGGVDITAISPGFDANDVGFISRSDRLDVRARVALRRLRPWGPIRRAEAPLTVASGWNYHGVNRSRSVVADVDVQFLNYWRVFYNVDHTPESLNDWKTRGGPLIVDPATTSHFLMGQTDARKLLSATVFARWTPNRQRRQKHLGTVITMNPTDALNLRVRPSYRWDRVTAEWVTNLDDDGDGRDDHYVFGRLTTNTLDLTTRADMTFTPRLSLQLYLQSFVTVGDYEDFKELARPESFDFAPYPAPETDPDFHRRSLRGHVVIRWEYRPGSALFLVWSQARNGSADNTDFRPLDGLGQGFTDVGRNVFLAKWSHWLGI